MAISHEPGRGKSNWFGVRAFDAESVCRRATSFETLEAALLFASDLLDIKVTDWRLYDPGRGVRLYSKPRTVWERKHSVQRRKFGKILDSYKYGLY